MAIQEITADNFTATVDNSGTVFVVFYRPGCPYCAKFLPKFEQMASEHIEASFARANADELRDLAASLNVTELPTFIAYRAGTRVYSMEGDVSVDDLEQVITDVESLDMDQIQGYMEEADESEPFQ